LKPEIPAKKKSKRFIIPAGFYSGKTVEERLDKSVSKQENIVNTVVKKTIAEPKKEVATETSNGIRRRSIMSLKSLSDKPLSSKKKKTSVNYDDLPKTPFDLEQFSKLWEQHIEKLNQKNEKLLASLLNSVSYKIKGFRIELTLPNARMQQEIEKSKSKVLNFLREELQNYAIDFDYIVNETIEKKFAYTPQEKYEYLKEKNPMISLLRKVLDLDVN